MKTKFEGKGGYDKELERAKKVFEIGKEYTIIGGTIGRSHSDVQFKEVEGSWNTVMFDFDIHECPLMVDSYSQGFSH